MNRRIIHAIALLIAIPMLGNAAPVSRSEAQQSALQFMIAKGIASQVDEMAFKAPRIGQQSDEVAYYYVFNAPRSQGYVIVSGDDRTAPVLGYSYKGTFNEAAMPQHVKAFLQTYADEIQYLDDAGIVEVQHAPRRAADDDYDEILPLLASRWDQGSPYNGLCPGGCPTGCAATSTAQVMYFHKWPAATAAEIPYLRTGSRHYTLEAIPEGTVIKWEDMTDTYSYSSTNEAKQAVAELMLYVGQSIKMDYDYMGSGAYSHDMTPAISDYFDYEVRQLFRKNYPLVAFEDSIYQQLANGYPVIFNGMSTGGGHSFVVDGYDSDHYFHVNWGWGGQDDNYFLLSVLNPYNNTSIGSSSSSDGFSFDQDVLFLKPGRQTSVVVNPLQMNIVGVTTQGVLLEYISVLPGSHVFELGLGALSDQKGILPLAGTLRKETIRYLYGEDDKEATVSGLEAGTHRLVPICRLQGDSVWTYDVYPYAEVKVNDDGTFEFNTVWNQMQTVNYEFEGDLFIGQMQPFKVTFRNDTDQDYYGPIYFFSNRGENKSANGRYSSFEGFSVQAHDSLMASFSFRPSTSGAWTVSFASDPNGKCVLGSCTVSIDAGELMVDGIRYKLTPETHEAKVVAGREEYVGHIVIPDTVVSNNRKYAVTALDKNAFYGCTELLSVVLPAPLTAIGDYCFEDCSSLTSITIPALVKSIGPGAFAGCISLADIQVNEHNAKYSAHGGMLFSNEGKTLNCYPSAKGVVNNLPGTLTIIGDGSFARTAITCLLLPESVIRFGSACFSGCEELTTIVLKARKAPSCLKSAGSGTFAGLDYDEVQVIIPVGAEASYYEADGWKQFTKFSLFKVYGEHSIQDFSALRKVDLDGIVVVDDNFEEKEAATVKAYKVDHFDSDDQKLYASVIQGIVEAAYGLLIEGESTLVFKTTEDPATVEVAGNLLYAAVVDTDLSTLSNAYTYLDGTFVPNTTDVVKAGGAFLLLDDATAPSIQVNFEDKPGGISTITVDVSESLIYDLQGRRVSNPTSGFYIQNGQKVLR